MIIMDMRGKTETIQTPTLKSARILRERERERQREREREREQRRLAVSHIPVKNYQ